MLMFGSPKNKLHSIKWPPREDPHSRHPGKNVHLIQASCQHFFFIPAINNFSIPQLLKRERAIQVSRQKNTPIPAFSANLIGGRN